MSQVVRYDQDNDLFLRLANGINLWKIRFFHPQRGEGSPVDVKALEDNCPMLPEAPDAFILSKRDTGDSKLLSCWDSATRLLRRGVATRTCAEYFFHDMSPRGFSLKFSRCPASIKIEDE